MDTKVTFHLKPFPLSMAGFVVPMMTASLSILSSCLILHIIRKSQIKLSSTHHRIMAFMSIFDIITSISVALGTIMMPSDNVYKFDGPMLGNKVTCQIQAWLIVFGFMGGASMIVCLCWYYVSVLTFKVDTARIQKYFEPIMFVCTLFVSFFFPIHYLQKDLFSPDPSYSYCTIAPYPDACEEPAWTWLACTWDRGGQMNPDYTMKGYKPIAITIVVIFFLVFILMLIVIWTVYDNQKKINGAQAARANHASADEESFNSNTDIGDNSDMDLSQLQYSRVIVRQALMYIFGFWITWFCHIFDTGYGGYNYYMDMLNTTLFPLAGFWNMIIFVYDKAYLVHQTGSNSSYWNAVKIVVLSPESVPAIFIAKTQGIDLPSQNDAPLEEPSNKSEILEEVLPSELYEGLSMSYSKRGSYSGKVSAISQLGANTNSKPEYLPEHSELKRKYYTYEHFEM